MTADSPSTAQRSARDPGLTLWSLIDRSWVKCPRCQRPALVKAVGRNRPRLSCTNCGYSRADCVKRASAISPSPWGHRCARCGQRFPRSSSSAAQRHGRELSKILRCAGCGARARYAFDAGEPDLATGVDTFFGLPFFLSTDIGGKKLWATNPEHLKVLLDYLGASLRKRALSPHHMTMMARLPRWMKAADRREVVLSALRQLQELAGREDIR